MVIQGYPTLLISPELLCFRWATCFLYMCTKQTPPPHQWNCAVDSYKLAIVVESNPKAPFSIATTPRCREGTISFPGLTNFTLDPYLIILSVKQGGIKYNF